MMLSDRSAHTAWGESFVFCLMKRDPRLDSRWAKLVLDLSVIHVVTQGRENKAKIMKH